MKNKQWMLRAVGVISALALGLGGLAACGNSSSAESKNGRVYYLNKKAEEQSTWVKLGKAFEKETGIPVQIQTGGTDYDATLRSELSKKAAPTMFQADGPSFMSSFKKYAKDLSNSDIYKQLDKNYKNRVRPTMRASQSPFLTQPKAMASSTTSLCSRSISTPAGQR